MCCTYSVRLSKTLERLYLQIIPGCTTLTDMVIFARCMKVALFKSAFLLDVTYESANAAGLADCACLARNRSCLDHKLLLPLKMLIRLADSVRPSLCQLQALRICIRRGSGHKMGLGRKDT